MNWLAFESVVVAFFVLQTPSSDCRLKKRNGYDHNPSHQLQLQHHHHHNQQHQSPSGSSSSYTHELSPPPPPPQQHHEEPDSSAKSSYFVHKPSSGYSIGSGLRSIAQGSANQAYSAVANQHAAAKQAAFIAKNALAQTATQAAATAQAALTGKEVILHELEQQAAEAHRSLARELEQLKSAKIAAKLAQQTAQAAQSHVSVLIAAVNDAKIVSDNAEHASNEVSNQLASQSAMVGQAKKKLEAVEDQLNSARVDYAATKEATLNAASSAAEAQINASKAGAKATIGLYESASQSHDSETAVKDDSTSYLVDEHIVRSDDGHEDQDHGGQTEVEIQNVGHSH